MGCPVCKREIKLASRGLCAACYQRWLTRGTTDYAPKRQRQKCQILDCDSWVVSNGLCDKHRLRLREHGHTNNTRPDSWGSIEKHPLGNAWRWLRKHQTHTPVCQQWQKDFLQFVTDVGEKPTPKHRLYRADDTRPIGPGNFVWKRSITEKVEGETQQTYSNRAGKIYRALRVEGYKGYDLKKKYGLSVEDYALMLKVQDGKCALCGKQETMMIRGKVMNLAVDHCHKRGDIRALLCSKCNQGLGCFNDDPALLQRAAKYVSV